MGGPPKGLLPAVRTRFAFLEEGPQRVARPAWQATPGGTVSAAERIGSTNVLRV
jgi:hypothetical protein